MASRRTQARTNQPSEYAARREQIIVEGANLFNEKGYAATRLLDVAQRLNMDRASMYYYFASKEDLFHAVIINVIEANLKACEDILATEATSKEKLAMAIRVILESYQKHYPYVYVYIQEDMAQIAAKDEPWAVDVAVKTRSIERIFLTLIKDGIVEKAFRSDLHPSLCANAIFGMISWTHRWFIPGKHFDAGQLAETFTKIFFEGVEADRPRRSRHQGFADQAHA